MSTTLPIPQINKQENTDGARRELLNSTRDRKVVDYVNKCFDKAKSDRMQFERAWYTNLAFYFGKQYAQWAPGVAGSKLYEPPAPSWRVRLVANKIRPIVRTELSKITKEKPQAYVIPSSTEDSDLLASRAGEAIVEHLFRTLNMDRMIRRTEFWVTLCGNGFLKDWYDPRKPVDETRGAIQVEPLSPFHIYVADTAEEELENQEFVIHTMLKSPEFVEQAFKKKLAADSVGGGDSYSRFLSAVGIQNQPKNSISVREGWFKPCKQFPKGAIITWAGETLLSVVEGLLYEHGEFPFTKFDHIPTGRFYTDSVVPDLIPLQKEYNRTRSQIVEAKNRMSKPQLTAPKGSVNPNQITSEPGLIVFYTPGMQPPTPIPLQNIPGYVIQELDRTQRDMDDISAQHEVTKGRTPPGVTAATAISYLQEEDDSKLSWTIASLEEGVERVGRHFLSHVKQFWEAQRSVKVLGANETYETQQLSKANIRGNTDFKVQAGSASPRSRAAKQAFLMELGKMGWITPDRALRYLDMAETGKLHEEMQLDARQAQRENLRISQGEVNLAEGTVPANDWDNHEAHIAEHNRFRKTQTFEVLDQELKAALQMHVDMHKQLLGQAMGQMIPPGMPLPQGPSSGNLVSGGQNPNEPGGDMNPTQGLSQAMPGPPVGGSESEVPQ